MEFFAVFNKGIGTRRLFSCLHLHNAISYKGQCISLSLKSRASSISHVLWVSCVMLSSLLMWLYGCSLDHENIAEL